MNSHDLGDLVRVSAVFTDVDSGDAFDPDVVKLSVRTPSGTVTTYVYGTAIALNRSATGNYYQDIDANEPGIWNYRWWSTGTGQAAEENSFEVLPALATE